MSRNLIARMVLAAGTLAAFANSQTASAATVACQTGPAPDNVMSCATGLAANLSVLNNVVTAGIGPIANVFDTAPAPYSLSNTLLTVSTSAAVGLATLGVNIAGNTGAHTAAVVDTASSPYNGSVATLNATATSTVNGLNLGLGIPAVTAGPITVTPAVSFLSIGADTLTSTSTAAKIDGGRVFSSAGTSQIENLGVSVGGVNVLTGINVLASTAPNDTLFDLGGLDIIANYQSPIYLNGSDRIGIQTAALAIDFDNFVAGAGILNGTILIADSAASVPEAGTWAMMLVGLGFAGMALRQRRSLALA